MGCSGEWDTVNERSLYHPSCKKGYAFLKHPLLKKEGSSGVIGSWVVLFPQSARLPHPEGWRTGLGSGFAMTLILWSVLVV
jgi:hypothetical protein